MLTTAAPRQPSENVRRVGLAGASAAFLAPFQRAKNPAFGRAAPYSVADGHRGLSHNVRCSRPASRSQAPAGCLPALIRALFRGPHSGSAAPTGQLRPLLANARVPGPCPRDATLTLAEGPAPACGRLAPYRGVGKHPSWLQPCPRLIRHKYALSSGRFWAFFSASEVPPRLKRPRPYAR